MEPIRKEWIYMDYNATTPCDERVVEAMVPWFYERPGNAASRSHPFGWEAETAVQQSREQVASLIGVENREIVFTSGATESNNLAIKGIFEAYARKGRHVITVASEHNAVLDTCEKLEKMGGEVTYLPVNEAGLINLQELESAIRPDTVLVAVMWANNETGVFQPMQAIGEICARHGVLFFSDATQAVGKISVDPRAIGCHLMAFSAHKMYGPKGVGALYISRRQPRVKVMEQLHGGRHEGGHRSGTLNVPGIVGFGKAAHLAKEHKEVEASRLAQLRDRLEAGLLAIGPEVWVNGAEAPRLPNTTNITFRFVDAEALIMTFNQRIAVSTGSACSSASLEPSHVLIAMGLNQTDANSSLRFSLGRYTTEAEVEEVVQALAAGVERLRAESPVWELFQEGVDLSE